MTLAINQRLAAKKDHHEAGMSALGGEIDQKIYPNYGMMSERIVIVEGTGK